MKKILLSFLILLTLPMKGQFSIGIVYGKARPINYLESNIKQLNNFHGSVSMNRPSDSHNPGYINISAQYGISVLYQKSRNIFTAELTGIRLGQNYALVNNDAIWPYAYGYAKSPFFTRINFQYGYEIWKSKNQKVSIIPSLAIGIMPYKNYEGATGYSIINNDTTARVVKAYNNRGLNTHITLGLSAKFYLNPRFDLMFSTAYSHGFADKYRYTYMKNFPGKGTMFFDIGNKARFYNANITFLYKLKKDTKVANKSIGHGAFSFGIISGKTFGKNKIDDNFNTLPNVDGEFKKFNNKKPFSNDNANRQFGIALNYQLKKHYYTLELTTNYAGAYYNLNSHSKGTDSVFNNNIGFIKYRRINLQYGYAVIETRSKRFSIIPTIGIAFMPYLNTFSNTTYTNDGNNIGAYEYTATGKYKRALNTSLVFGLTARVKLNQRFALQGNATYTCGFSEQYRLSFQKSYGADGTLYFDVYNKARYYNANLSLLYTFQKAKTIQKNDMMELK